MRFPITNRCLCCNQQINEYGIIIYMNHETYRVYRWLHINCLKNLTPQQAARVLYFDEKAIKPESCLSSVGCSYCGQINITKPLQNFVFFYLHKKCIKKLEKKSKAIYKKNEAKIIAGLL
jgi:hypothetical protein